MTQIDEKILIDEDIETGLGAMLIVHNDDVNSFDWVIESFISLLSHSAAQAEQCATIIHTKGKCQVKSGDFEDMCKYKDGLVDRGLSATVEV